MKYGPKSNEKIFLFILFSLSLFFASVRLFSERANFKIANGTPARGMLTGTLDDVTGLFNYTLVVTNTSCISPLDLDRNPRNFGGTSDMGAFEFLGNTPSQLPVSTITGTIDSPTYAGGAIQTITSTAKILAPAGAIDFKAPNAIILSPGFEARGVGKYFKAEIGANVGCVNP